MLTHIKSELWEMKESSKTLFLASFCSLSFPTLTLPTGGHCVNYGGVKVCRTERGFRVNCQQTLKVWSLGPRSPFNSCGLDFVFFHCHVDSVFPLWSAVSSFFFLLTNHSPLPQWRWSSMKNRPNHNHHHSRPNFFYFSLIFRSLFYIMVVVFQSVSALTAAAWWDCERLSFS